MKKTLAKDIKSPLTGGRVFLVEDVETQEFRKESYQVHVRYFVCEDTGEEFNNAEQGDMTCNELYNQYRVKHGVPFPDEIKATREKYGLSFAQITKIVGFGQNQWRQYENGQVPSESNGKSIVAISSKSGMLSMLMASREEFSKEEFSKIWAQVMAVPDNEEKDIRTLLFYGNTSRSIYNGFSPMSPNKLEAMVRMFVHNEKGGIVKTKLNKEMFYADFLHYRRHGRSISGLQYKAIQLGPVPVHYDTIYDHVEGIQKEIVETNNLEYTLLKCDNPNITALDEEEKKTITEVSKVLSPMTRQQVVELSHTEDAWKLYKDSHELIPYMEAFSLKEFE